jgi:hypothetical protein
MKKQANKKLALSTETVRSLTSTTELGQVAGGQTTAISCDCTTTAIICPPPSKGCTTAIICG